MMEKKTLITVLSLLVMVGMLISPGHVLAEETPPQFEDEFSRRGPAVPGLEEPLKPQQAPRYPDRHGEDLLERPYQGLIYTEDGLLYVDNRHSPSITEGFTYGSLNFTGGPDDYGYTWARLEQFDWIDVSGGMGTGIDSGSQYSGMIDIGFDFRYYENTYNKIYISRHGFVSFNDEFLSRSQSRIPFSELPNDVIAPHWVPSDDINYVKYQTGGSTPDRWFVVEWNQLLSVVGHQPDIYESIYTFELILFENGDIQFQYDEMVNLDSWACQSSGIEDRDGLDGLSITELCQQLESNHAIRVTRPEDSARVSLKASTQGNFINVGQTTDYTMTLRNTGDLGPDSYTLDATSTWPLAFFEMDGVTEIDAQIDLEQGEALMFIARVIAPTGAGVGAANEAMVTATSVLDPTKSKTVTITAAIPAPFAQIMINNADYGLASYLVTPESQERVIPFGGVPNINNMGIMELPNGNLLFSWDQLTCLEWDSGSCLNWASMIKYAISDRWGEAVLHPTFLSDILVGTVGRSDDYQPFLAVAPNGNIGVLWYREQYFYEVEIGTITYNYNIHFAILDPEGAVLFGPENITGDESNYGWDEIGFTSYPNPRLAATDDGQFLLAWQKFELTDGPVLRDIYYSIRGNTGETVVDVTKLTEWIGEVVSLENLTLTDLEGGHIFIAWYQDREICDDENNCWWEWGTVYTVLDSSGDEIKAQAYLNYTSFGNPDSIQLSDGTILLAGGWGTIRYMLFDGTSYEPLGEQHWLPNPGYLSNQRVSVTKDMAGHAILTWQYNAGSGSRLAYALIASDGELVTAPITFYPPIGTDYVRTSLTGQGNTTYRSNFPPVFISEPITQTIEGEHYSYVITAKDPDLPDDELTISATTKPDWLTFMDNGDGTAILTGTPGKIDLGKHAVVLMVTDNKGLTDKQEFILTVIQDGIIETIGPEGGTILSSDEKVKISVPPNAISSDTEFLFVSQSNPSQDTGDLGFGGISFLLTAKDIVSGEPVTAFAHPLIVKIHYDETELGAIAEESLRLYFLNDDNIWVDVITTCADGEYTRNIDENWFSVGICHLSEFAVLGSEVYEDEGFQLFLPLILH